MCFERVNRDGGVEGGDARGDRWGGSVRDSGIKVDGMPLVVSVGGGGGAVMSDGGKRGGGEREGGGGSMRSDGVLFFGEK